MQDQFGRPRVAVPVDGLAGSLTSPEKVGAVAAAASPFLDLLVPGLGVAATGVLGGLGYGVRKGRQTGQQIQEEKEASFNTGVKRAGGNS